MSLIAPTPHPTPLYSSWSCPCPCILGCSPSGSSFIQPSQGVMYQATTLFFLSTRHMLEEEEATLSWAIMERRLAASINILSRTSTMSVHPYENPEVLSFPVEDGNLAYMKWMDEAIPED
ncbi:hypothetical protein FQN60_008172 [Etheostoma spectabile]|uniref:Uncharacterized protein n=1 Tax=Etheostoma spectabile TaxID=54343 RepID=A0A5J5CRG5_9PERO|nr:hypothetical protein FQN60_008172 [Etheostoma spectabile]